MATYIGKLTSDFRDMVDWAMLLWKDVDAPLEWRWKAFEWLTTRGLGSAPSVVNLTVNEGVNSGRDLRRLSDADIARIDQVFLEAVDRPEVIDVESDDV